MDGLASLAEAAHFLNETTSYDTRSPSKRKAKTTDSTSPMRANKALMRSESVGKAISRADGHVSAGKATLENRFERHNVAFFLCLPH